MGKCGRPPLSAQLHLVATSTTVVYEWFTPWMLATGLDTVKAAIRRRGTGATFQCQLAMQVAPVRTDKPNDPSVLGQMVSGASETCTGLLDVSATTAANYFVRFGIAYSLTTGSTVAQADVSVDLSDDGCGSAIGALNVALQANGVGNSFVAATGWVPLLQAQKAKLAVVCNSLTGNFQWRVAYRLATTSTQDPGAWTTTFDSWRTAGEVCVADLTPATTDNEMYIQLGIQYNLSSGSTLGQASISAVVAARKT